jgi:hypothetical protein
LGNSGAAVRRRIRNPIQAEASAPTRHQQILPDLLFVHHIRNHGGKVRIVEHEIE